MLKTAIFGLITLMLVSCGTDSRNASIPEEVSDKEVVVNSSKYEFLIEESCGFDVSMRNKTVYTFNSDSEAENAIQRIMRLTGLPANFEIKAASVPNACAVIKCDGSGNCDRYILYSQEFMESIKSTTKTHFAELAILAHEIAHHLSGHTLTSKGSNYDMELEADKFAGFMLFKMGATIKEAKAAFITLPASGSDSHPPRSARIAAVANGWYEAKRNGESVTPLNQTKSSDNSNNESQESTSSTHKASVKVGDYYQGGVIAYLFTPAEKNNMKSSYGVSYTGIITAPFDQSSGIEWGALQTRISTTRNGTDLFYECEDNGAGFRAINKIQRSTNEAKAANLCSDLVLNGYSDWVLPTRFDLRELYEARYIIGGFKEGETYWSSSYDDISEHNWPNHGKVKYSYAITFENQVKINNGYSSPRHFKYRVRAVRYF